MYNKPIDSTLSVGIKYISSKVNKTENPFSSLLLNMVSESLAIATWQKTKTKPQNLKPKEEQQNKWTKETKTQDKIRRGKQS